MEYLKYPYWDWDKGEVSKPNAVYGAIMNLFANGTNITLESLPFEIQSGLWKSQVVMLSFLCFTAVFFYYCLINFTRSAKLINTFPGPTPLPFIGNFNVLMVAPEEWQKQISNLFKKYGKAVRVWLGHKPFLIIADGKVAERVLSGYTNIEKAENYSAFHRVLGHGLVTAPGAKWKRDRKLLNPAFGYQYFEGWIKIFNEQSEIMAEILEETFRDNKSHIDMLPYIARCTMDSVFQTVLGTPRDLQRNPQEQYAERVYGLVECTREKILHPWMHLPLIWHWFGKGKKEDALIDGLMEDLAKVIDKKFEEKESGNDVSGTHTKPFIAFLMDEVKDRNDLAFQINTLCATGSETTSSSLNYLLFLLALNPECQDQIQEEIDRVLEGDLERSLELKDYAELKYMEMCIKEALRLYPSVPGWLRKLSKDVNLDDGRVVPSGTQVAIFPWDIHRNSEVFPDPDVFDPERFHPDKTIHSYEWMSFSSGPRNCIGHRYGMLQMKTMLTYILKKFNVSTISNREDLRVIYGIVLEPVPNLKLRLTLRHTNLPVAQT